MITKNAKILSYKNVENHQYIIGIAKVEIFDSVSFMVKVVKGKSRNFISFPNVWDKVKSSFVDVLTINESLKTEIESLVLSNMIDTTDTTYDEKQLPKKEIVVNDDLLDDDIPF